MKWLQWPFLFLLGAFNRDTPLGRLLLIAPGIAVCGWKGLLLMCGVGKPDALTIPKQCWGFCDPGLKWDTDGSFGHKATDFVVEWVRVRPQRAAKGLGAAILVLAAVAAIGWAI